MYGTRTVGSVLRLSALLLICRLPFTLTIQACALAGQEQT
jgi:hypothetical protein